MATRLLVPSDIICKYEDKCKDMKYKKCNICKNNKKNISREVKQSFFSFIKESR